MKQTVLLSHHRQGTEMDEPISLNADTSVTSLLSPRWGYRLMTCSFRSAICFVFLQSSDK